MYSRTKWQGLSMSCACIFFFTLWELPRPGIANCASHVCQCYKIISEAFSHTTFSGVLHSTIVLYF